MAGYKVNSNSESGGSSGNTEVKSSFIPAPRLAVQKENGIHKVYAKVYSIEDNPSWFVEENEPAIWLFRRRGRRRNKPSHDGLSAGYYSSSRNIVHPVDSTVDRGSVMFYGGPSEDVFIRSEWRIPYLNDFFELEADWESWGFGRGTKRKVNHFKFATTIRMTNDTSRYQWVHQFASDNMRIGRVGKHTLNGFEYEVTVNLFI